MYEFETLDLNQLIEKQIEIRKKIGQASRAGMSSQIINQMEIMLDNLQIEIKTKAALEREQKDRELKIEKGEDPDDSSLIIGE
jgi:hypothetical protein